MSEVRFNVIIVDDPNPRRCRGLGRYCVRCKRQGEPVDGMYLCWTHASQRDIVTPAPEAPDATG